MTRVALQSEVYTPENAVDAGFIDEVVEAAELDARAMAIAEGLAKLPRAQYAANKLAIREHTLKAMRDSVDQLVGG